MSKPYKVTRIIRSTETVIYNENGELVEERVNDDGMVWDEEKSDLTDSEMTDYFPDWSEK